MKIDLSQLTALQGQLEKAAEVDTTSLMRELGSYLARETRAAFNRGIDPITGQGWAPNAPLTLAGRPSGKAGKKLQREGRLLQSLIANVKVDRTTARIGSNLPYAYLHQHGGKIGAQKGKYMAIPANREAARSRSASDWLAANPDVGVWVFGKDRRPWAIGKKVGRKGQKVQTMYILKEEVEIPARRYLGIGPLQKMQIERIASGWIGKKFGKLAESIGA